MAQSSKAKIKAAEKTSRAKAITKADPTTNWAAYNAQRWRIERLVPSDRNVKVHHEGQILKIAALIQEVGWTMPILIDERGGIIAGHGRYLAAQHIGLTEVPVIVAKGWTDRQIRAYRLADNRLAEEGVSYDTAKLMSELKELGAEGYDLPSIGYDDDFMRSMLQPPEIGNKPLGPTVVSQSTQFEPPDDSEGEDDGYAPNLNPERGKGEVTPGDVDKAGAALAAKPTDQAKQNLVELICPHCGESYEVDRGSIA